MGSCETNKKKIPKGENPNKIKNNVNQINNKGNINQKINQKDNHNQNDDRSEENESNRWDDELEMPKTAPPTLIVQKKKD